MKPSKSLVCLQIKSISNLMHQELAGTAHCGTMMQKMFLGYLDAHKGQPVFQKDLEAAFHIRRSTATGILQIMERDVLLRREPVEQDARLKRLVLTSPAYEQLAQMQQDIIQLEAKATAGLSPEEQNTLFTLLSRIIQNLTPSKEERHID